MYDAASMRARFNKTQKNDAEYVDVLRENLYNVLCSIDAVCEEKIEIIWVIPAKIYKSFSSELHNLGYNVNLIKESRIFTLDKYDPNAESVSYNTYYDNEDVERKINEMIRAMGEDARLKLSINWRRNP